ncbi:uncharacterized protein [Littorina saxatilis]|uniref:uncharacterized protein isoform X2 n=1 Tax=Littorina saxatilis TaxID=31220 RepID=UPI0038B46FFA
MLHWNSLCQVAVLCLLFLAFLTTSITTTSARTPGETGGSTNNSRASPWHSSHSATQETQKSSSHPNDQKTSVPLSQHDQSEGVTAARQKAKDTEHAGPVLSPVKDIHREEQVFDLRLKNDDNETAPTRSYPTNGRTKSKKTLAVVNEADGRSKPKKTMAFWNEADGRSQPKKTLAVVNEADGRSKPKKTMAVWDQTEGRWKEKTQDESGTVSRRPLKGSIKEDPGNVSNKEALENSSTKEDPGNGSIKETLEKGSIKEDPGNGSIKEDPGNGSIKEDPGNGSIKETLEKGSIKEDPGNDSIKEAPGNGFIKEASGNGFIKEAPAKGFIEEAAEKGSIKEAPGNGFIKEAPAKGFIKEAAENGSIKEAPGKGSIKETEEDHIHKDHKEKQAVLTDLKTNLGDTYTAPKLPQNEWGIVQHARKGQNEHKAVSTSLTKDQFENDPVSPHTQKDENVPGYSPDPWRQDVTGKGTTSFPLQQDHEEMDENCSALAPFGEEHGLHRVERANNDPDCRCDECDISAKGSNDLINVAYNKPVTASSHFNKSRPLCLLVDGISTPTVAGTCMHTDHDDHTPWVEVNMGAVYTVRKILIVRRQVEIDKDIKQLWALTLHMDGQTCYTWPPYNFIAKLKAWESNNTYDVRCDTDVTGQYIRLEKLEQAGFGPNYHIMFCEVTVMVCKPKFWGPPCRLCPTGDDCKYVCNNLLGCDKFAPWNVALKKFASTSSLLKGGPANAVDGTNSNSSPDKCVSTHPVKDGADNRWWQVDMEASYRVFKLFIHTRVDCCGQYYTQRQKKTR